MAGSDRAKGGSVEQQVTAEHRKLDTLFAETRAAFRSGRDAATRNAFGQLRDALDAHFEQEDRLYYPTIWALRPDRKAPLRVFVEAHERFRARFEAIADSLQRDSLAEAERAFEEFSEAFAQHEAGEERLLRSLEAEVAASA